MTIQFKKFLIGLLALAFGIVTFFILVFLTLSDAGLEGIAYFLIYIGLSFGSIFIYYILLKKLLHNSIYSNTEPLQENQAFKKPNLLLDNKFSILVLINILLFYIISNIYEPILYGTILTFAILGLFKDKKVGKFLIVILGVLFLIFMFYGRQTWYEKCLQEKIIYESDPKNNGGSFTCVN